MLPNIRKIFIPDPGYEIFDTDLDSADLRIVTWESNCQWMKDCFASGLKPYVEIAKEYYHDPAITKQHPKYKSFKAFCHATNYLGRAKNIAGRMGLLVVEAERMQTWYFDLCPEIKVWQDNLIQQVDRTHTVHNAFGYHRMFFDRITANTYNEAVAWIPQSTVGILINHIWDNIVETVPEVQILMQVHDSLVGQWPIAQRGMCKYKVLGASKVPVPYPEPLYIPLGVKTSTLSWGDCE